MSAHSNNTVRFNRNSLPDYGSRTDVGRVRDHNEDSLLVTPHLFAVADGMGGHAAGEVASELAIATLSNQISQRDGATELCRAVDNANRAILNAAANGQGREGMGTTLTAALLKGERLTIAQVGDSRAYLMHAGTLQQLTRDHSLVADLVEAGEITPAEARVHPNRSIITRALGTSLSTRPDLYELNVSPGDRILLCSDGLYSMVEDDDILRTMLAIPDPQLCAQRLVDQALHAGGTDNVTVIVRDVKGNIEKRKRRHKRKSKFIVIIVAIAIVAALGGAAWGVYSYINNSAYLADENGYVAIYRGTPNPVLGFSCSELVQTTTIPTDDLKAVNALLPDRLRNKEITTSGVSEAEKLVSDYEQQIAQAKSTAASQSAASGTAATSGTSTSSTSSKNTPSSTTASTGETA